MIPITKLIKSLESYFWTKRSDNTAEGHIYSNKNGIYDIGSPDKPFRNVYARNIIGTPAVSGNLISVSASDVTPGYLDGKLTVSGILSKSIVGSGSETLNLTVNTGTLLLRSGANSLTGNLAVATGVTIDGVDLDVHRDNPDAHHNAATGGNGITVSGTQAISVRLATDPALEFSGLDLRVKVGASITRNSSGVNVNLAHNYTWTGNHIFQTDTRIAGNLIFQGANRKIQTESNNNLWLEPHGTGHILLPEYSKNIRTDGAVTGFLGKGWQLNNDSGGWSHLDIRSIYAEELHVTAFIADIARVQVGETFLSNSMALVADVGTGFTVPAIGNTGKIYVEDNPAMVGQAFDDSGAGDYVMLRFIDRSGGGLIVASAWGQVTAYNAEVAIDGVQSYTWTTRSGTLAIGLTAKMGSLVIGFGRSGDSFIHQSVIASDAPWTRYRSWATNPYTPANITTHVQVGNLSGITDSTLNPTGHGLYATNVFLKGKLRTVNTVVDENGLALTHTPVATTASRSEDGFKFIRSLDDTVHSGIFGHTSTSATPIHTLDLVSGAAPATQSGVHRVRVTASGAAAHSATITLFASTNMPSTGITILADAGLTPTRRVSIDANLIELISSVTTADIRAHHLSPTADNTYDLGTNTRHWKDLYVKNIIADTITGSVALGGQVWQYDAGDMRIRSNSASARTLFIENTLAGTMSLNVEGNIAVGGTVDGVNVSGLFTSFSTHVTDVNAHHARSHDLDSVSDHTGTLAWNKVNKTGSDLVDLAFRAHSSLTGSTTGDDHTQYVHISSARTIVARHTFNPPTANSPFILGANAIGQLVAGLYAAQVDRNVIAGNGLIGGGVLSIDRTLTVGAGNGITVNASDVAVNMAYAFTWTNQHVWNTGVAGPPFVLNAIHHNETVNGLRADHLNKSVIAGDGLTGGGLLDANRTLTVGAGSGITVSGSAVAVNQTFAFAWTAQHAFNPATVIPPFTLNANAQGQTVVGFRADQLNKTVTAGGGLTGGGLLTANITLAIGEGNGIIVDPTAIRVSQGLGIIVDGSGVAVNQAYGFNWTVQHTFSPGTAIPPFALNASAQGQTVIGFRADQLNKTITAGDGLTGGGILTADRTVTLGTPGTLHISSTNAVTATSHVHAITTTSNAQTTPSVILASDASGYLLLNRLTTPTITSSTFLEFTPVGSVIVNPTGKTMLPGGTIDIDLGAYNRKWARVYAEELIITHLVQREVTATLGGSITVNPTTSLIADVGTGDTTIDVKDNIFLDGSFIRLSTLTAAGIAQTEAMKITSTATVITGGHRYTVTRALSPYTAKAWAAGDAVISLGAAVGSGWIELVSEETSLGHDGPNIAMYARHATTNWNSVNPVVSFGNLRDWVDYSVDTFGFALGNNLALTPTTGFSGLTADPTNGLRMFDVDLVIKDGTFDAIRISKNNGIILRSFQYNSWGDIVYEWPKVIRWFDQDNNTAFRMEQEITNNWYYPAIGDPEPPENRHTQSIPVLGNRQSTYMIKVDSSWDHDAEYNLRVGNAIKSGGSGSDKSDVYLTAIAHSSFDAHVSVQKLVLGFNESFEAFVFSKPRTQDTTFTMRHSGTAGNPYRLGVRNESGTHIGYLSADPSNAHAGTRFDFDVDGTTIMSLANGRLGIGQTIPTHPLHIKANSGNTTVRIEAHDGAFLDFFSGQIATGFSGVWAYGASNALSLGTNGADRIRILSDGKVGIGTPTPPVHFQVHTANNLEMARFSSDGGSGSVQGIGRIGLTAFLNAAHPHVYIGYEEFGTGSFQGHLTFGTRGAESDSLPAERMRITRTGLVGIGTNDPLHSLHVKGAFGAALGFEGAHPDGDGRRWVWATYAFAAPAGALSDGAYLRNETANITCIGVGKEGTVGINIEHITGTQLLIRSGAAARGVLHLRMAASPTADPFEVQNSSGISIFRLTTGGMIEDYSGGRTSNLKFRTATARTVDPVSISTTVTALLELGSDRSHIVMVHGVTGTSRFMDLVSVLTYAGVSVIHSHVSGGPAARTYSISNRQLRLVMASGTYSVQAIQIMNINE